MHVFQSLSMIGALAIGAATAAVPDAPHNVTPIDVNTAAPKFLAKEVASPATENRQSARLVNAATALSRRSGSGTLVVNRNRLKIMNL